MKITIDLDADEQAFVRGDGMHKAGVADRLFAKMAQAMPLPIRAGDRVRDLDGDEGRALHVSRGYAWVIFDDSDFTDDLVPLDKLVRV